MSLKNADAAELALKAHAFGETAGLRAEIPDGRKLMQEMRSCVNLTEAPEDAVCSLVIDLMHFCEREQIDWDEDVLSRARRRFRRETAVEPETFAISV